MTSYVTLLFQHYSVVDEAASGSTPTEDQWIWEFFKDSGYVTMHAEEECIVNNSGK